MPMSTTNFMQTGEYHCFSCHGTFPNMSKDKKQICLSCGLPMKRQKDTMTGKLSNYLWRCKCTPPGLEVSIG